MFVQLYLNTTAQAPDGPGWYISALDTASNGNMVEYIPAIRVTPAKALELASIFEQMADGRQLNWSEGAIRTQESLSDRIKAGTEEIKQVTRRNLDEAEEAAKKVALLRRALKELEEEDG